MIGIEFILATKPNVKVKLRLGGMKNDRTNSDIDRETQREGE